MEENRGFKMKGFSGFGNSPVKQKQTKARIAKQRQQQHDGGGPTFNEAFAKARKEQGAGGTSTWNGKKYSTARKDDKSVAGQFLSPDLKDVDSGQQFTDPHGHIKKGKHGNVEDLDYIHHEGKITGTK